MVTTRRTNSVGRSKRWSSIMRRFGIQIMYEDWFVRVDSDGEDSQDDISDAAEEMVDLIEDSSEDEAPTPAATPAGSGRRAAAPARRPTGKPEHHLLMSFSLLPVGRYRRSVKDEICWRAAALAQAAAGNLHHDPFPARPSKTLKDKHKGIRRHADRAQAAGGDAVDGRGLRCSRWRRRRRQRRGRRLHRRQRRGGRRGRASQARGAAPGAHVSDMSERLFVSPRLHGHCTRLHDDGSEEGEAAARRKSGLRRIT